MLVEKGISIHKYHAALNAGIALFFTLTILIPICALMHYVAFEKADLRWNGWPNSILGTFSNEKGGLKKTCDENEGSLRNSFIALKAKRSCFLPMPDLSKHLVILEHRIRPDQITVEQSILLGIEGSGERRIVHNGQRVFLDCPNEKEFSFSDKENPFWFEARIYRDEADIVFHVGFEGGDQDILYESSQVIKLQRKKDLPLTSRDENGVLGSIVEHLKSWNISESDVLIQMYGGNSYESVKGLYRMSSDSLKIPYFIKAGDLFVWRDQKLVDAKNNTLGLPLLMVTNIDTQKCEFILWDSEGVCFKQFALPVSKPMPPTVRPQELILKVHQRTDASVTCQLYKHNVILRKGDWLLYSNGRFRNLRTFDEVNDYLGYALKGELFIFDGLVKKEGITSFIGHLFNEERTQVKKLEIPLAEKKKVPLLKKKEAKVSPVQVKDE